MKSQFLLSVKEHMLAHPSKLSEDDVIRFLSHLAIDEKVAVKTQALALNAISFLYRDFF